MTLILSQVTIMSETEEIISGMLKAQDLSYHSPIHSSETVVSKQAGDCQNSTGYLIVCRWLP